jgi:hypothetical protein
VLPSRDGSSWAVSWYDSYVRGVRPGLSAETPLEWTPWNMLNQNLAGTLYRLSTPVATETGDVFDVSLWDPGPRVIYALTLAAQMAVLGLLARSTWPRRRGAPEHPLRGLGEGGVVCCALLLLSPWSSKTHFGLLLMPALYAAAEGLGRRDRVTHLLLAVAALLGLLTAKDVWGRDLVNGLLARGSVAWCTVVLMAASARLLVGVPVGPDGASTDPRRPAEPGSES